MLRENGIHVIKWQQIQKQLVFKKSAMIKFMINLTSWKKNKNKNKNYLLFDHKNSAGNMIYTEEL